MHELAVTQSILDISLKAAGAQHAARIRTIRLTIGPFSGIVPECVQMYLEVLAKGTIAEGAKIEAVTLPLRVRCRACGAESEIDRRHMLHRVLTCYHCKDHPCYDACPKKGAAMKIDDKLGVVYIDEAYCIGCGLCAKHCKFTPSRITMIKDKVRKEWKAAKCDLCRGREEGPACVQYCPVRCLGLSDNSQYVDEQLVPGVKGEEC